MTEVRTFRDWKDILSTEDVEKIRQLVKLKVDRAVEEISGDHKFSFNSVGLLVTIAHLKRPVLERMLLDVFINGTHKYFPKIKEARDIVRKTMQELAKTLSDLGCDAVVFGEELLPISSVEQTFHRLMMSSVDSELRYERARLT